MGIIRKNPSGKSVQFITDEGVVYNTSLHFLLESLKRDNSSGKEFLLLTKYPNPVNPRRFPQSKVYDPETGTLYTAEEYKGTKVDGIANANDAFSNKARADIISTKKDIQSYTDKEIDW